MLSAVRILLSVYLLLPGVSFSEFRMFKDIIFVSESRAYIPLESQSDGDIEYIRSQGLSSHQISSIPNRDLKPADLLRAGCRAVASGLKKFPADTVGSDFTMILPYLIELFTDIPDSLRLTIDQWQGISPEGVMVSQNGNLENYIRDLPIDSVQMIELLRSSGQKREVVETLAYYLTNSLLARSQAASLEILNKDGELMLVPHYEHHKGELTVDSGLSFNVNNLVTTMPFDPKSILSDLYEFQNLLNASIRLHAEKSGTLSGSEIGYIQFIFDTSMSKIANIASEVEAESQSFDECHVLNAENIIAMFNRLITSFSAIFQPFEFLIEEEPAWLRPLMKEFSDAESICLSYVKPSFALHRTYSAVLYLMAGDKPNFGIASQITPVPYQTIEDSHIEHLKQQIAASDNNGDGTNWLARKIFGSTKNERGSILLAFLSNDKVLIGSYPHDWTATDELIGEGLREANYEILDKGSVKIHDSEIGTLEVKDGYLSNEKHSFSFIDYKNISRPKS